MTEFADVGIAEFGTPSEDGQTGYEQSRMEQALKAAGIPAHMLNPMDMAALRAALTMDSTVLEEGTAGSAFTSLGGFRDQLHLTEEERAEREGKKPQAADMEEEPETSILGNNVVSMILFARRRKPSAFTTIDSPDYAPAITEAGSIFQEAQIFGKHDMSREEGAFTVFALAKLGIESGSLLDVLPDERLTPNISGGLAGLAGIKKSFAEMVMN